MKTQILLATLLLITIITPVFSAITPRAKVAYVEGKVLIKRRGSNTFEPAEVGASLYYGDVIITKGSSRAQLNLTTSGVLRLAQNSNILFPENIDDGVASSYEANGKKWIDIKKLQDEEVFEVRTPTLATGGQDQHGQRRVVINSYQYEMNNLKNYIEAQRKEGNARLDQIRAWVDTKVGNSITQTCPNTYCQQPHGPHYWDGIGWTCPYDGFTVATPGTLETPYGSYTKTREEYAARIRDAENRIDSIHNDNLWW